MLYQIWIMPNKQGVKPRWETKAFPKDFAANLSLLVSGREQDKESGALFIYQDAAIYGGRLKAGAEIKQEISDKTYILASKGKFTVNGVQMNERDGAEVTDAKLLDIKADADYEILVIDVGNYN